MEGLSFEAALQRLEEIVDKLESGNLELEQSVQVFEEGMELSVYCRLLLQQAEGRIQRLIQDQDGKLELQDLAE